LTSAEAEYETPYGLAKSRWRKAGEGLVIEAKVPPNSTATLVVPRLNEGVPMVTESGKTLQLTRRGDQFVCNLEPGQYEFEIR
jgi:alpha-L-rhamnosidase